MRGINAFCPKTGASLSDQQHYDSQGRSYRSVIGDEVNIEPSAEGELTNGAIRSSTTALVRYFRCCHRHHDEPDGALYRRASLAIQQLKRTASGREGADVHIWYALYHRLDRLGCATEWMHSHAELRCPRCHGQLKYTTLGSGMSARCGTNCNGRYTDCLVEIREIVVALYTKTFPDDESGISTNDVLQF